MDHKPKRSLANLAGSAGIACAYIAIAVAVVQAAIGSDDWPYTGAIGLGIGVITIYTYFVFSALKAILVRIGPSIRRRSRFTLSSLLLAITLLCILAAVYRVAPVQAVRTAGFLMITLLPVLLRMGWYCLTDEA